MPYSTQIYESWKKIQREKYEQVWPRVSEHFNESFSVLDFGIGKGWFYDYLADQSFRFAHVVGVDNDAQMVIPRKPGILYVITGEFRTPERFDALISFDALHLAKEPKNLFDHIKPGALALVTEPARFKDSLSLLNQPPFQLVDEGEIGETEEDFYTLARKVA